jgi:hypothetical protein
VADYVFRARFRLPTDPAVATAAPDEFETTAFRPAAEPGEPGWLFFRDALWRGEAADDAHVRSLLSDWLGVRVVAADFRELRCSPDYLARWEAAVDARLDDFDAADASEVRHRYLGSSVHVVDGDGDDE